MYCIKTLCRSTQFLHWKQEIQKIQINESVNGLLIMILRNVLISKNQSILLEAKDTMSKMEPNIEGLSASHSGIIVIKNLSCMNF